MFLKTPGSEARLVGLRTGTVYVVQVRARTEAGYGAFSGDVLFRTLSQSECRGRGNVHPDSTTAIYIYLPSPDIHVLYT